uniref:RNA-directed DNA polymerase, eukaryota, reverse transcriptase zinc-binding domain protein n=1 Tax=Lactuca sativa TaxID=4236 RepID=A0A9R1VF04_LACSA|nr:hypothetical protein LSAT_V11C500260230 [Lactuca sativa]
MVRPIRPKRLSLMRVGPIRAHLRSQMSSLLMFTNALEFLVVTQRSRLNWEVDGDENTKFLHGIVNNNKRKNRIHGFTIDGVWVNEPSKLKQEILEFFSNKFDEPLYNRPKLISNRFKRISDFDRDSLTKAFSEMEIKDAIWCCGNNNASGPDEFTLKFLQH